MCGSSQRSTVPLTRKTCCAVCISSRCCCRSRCSCPCSFCCHKWNQSNRTCRPTDSQHASAGTCTCVCSSTSAFVCSCTSTCPSISAHTYCAPCLQQPVSPVCKCMAGAAWPTEVPFYMQLCCDRGKRHIDTKASCVMLHLLLHALHQRSGHLY